MELRGWRLVSLITAAIFGGYLLATASGVFLGAVLPVPRGQAVTLAYLLSFVVYTAAVLWVFTVRRPLRAWTGMLVPAALLAVSGMLLRGTAP